MDTISYNPPNTILSPLRSCLVLVDYQSGLMPAIDQHTVVLREAQRLAQMAKHMEVPIIATEQNPDRLGETVDSLAELSDERLAKAHFDACALKQLPNAIPTGRSQIIVAGYEAHVCLMQTALGLLHYDYDVFVVGEACGSRRDIDKQRGLARLEKAGAVLISPEMAGFEWLQSYQHPKFRQMLELIKPL